MKQFFIHIHIYYYDIWQELKIVVKNFEKFSADLVITLSESVVDKQDVITDEFPQAQIISVPNRGYDIAPFLMVLKSINLDDYQYVVKLHTKRDVPVGAYLGYNYVGGKLWREYLLEPFFSEENINTCMALFENYPSVGMISHYNCCFLLAKDSLKWMFLDRFQGIFEELPKNYKYVAGAMFMARSSVLHDFQNLPYSMNDFEVPRPKSFQLAHYLERLLGYYVYKNTYTVESYDCSNKVKRYFRIVNAVRKKFVRILIGNSGRRYFIINFYIKVPFGKVMK